MRIAIHKREGSFSDGWIEYCDKNRIQYRLVNAYDTNIISQIKDCDAFMWHFNPLIYMDQVFAKQLLFSLQMSGMRVFPDFNTCWHFDDKVGQKYLFESIGAPFVPSHVYFSKSEALDWVARVELPIVYKLRVGAGSSNVELIRSKSRAKRLVKKSFGKGLRQYSYFTNVKEGWRRYKLNSLSLKGLIYKFLLLLVPPTDSFFLQRERGYFYTQNFITDNDYDIRLIVIGGDKAYGMKRRVRKNDFRASGSSDFIYDDIPPRILEIGFDVAQRLKLQSVAFDVIQDNGEPFIIEMSCFFGTKGSNNCPGYWDRNYNWHPTTVNPCGWIVEDLLKY